MSFTTTSADNIITIGDTNDTIKLNKIMPMYTSVPTYSLNYIGGFVLGTPLNQNTNISTTKPIYQFLNVPVGNYLANCHFKLNAGGQYGFEIRVSDTSGTSSTSWQWTSTTWNSGATYTVILPYQNNSNDVYINLSSGGTVNPASLFYGYLIRIG